MKMPLTTLVANLRYAGRNSGGVQIPQITIGRITEPKTGAKVDKNYGTNGVEELIEVQEDYFIEVNNGALAVGRESGFTFLSERGWNALKPKLQEVYRNLQKNPDPCFQPRTSSWAEIELGMPQFFEKVRTNTQKKITKLRKKADEAEKEYSKYFV